MENISSSFRRYGFPLFWVSWVPFEQIDKPSADEKKEEEPKFDDRSTRYLVFGGGGGEGRTGISNSIVLTQFDFTSNNLSEPVDRLGTNSDASFRMAMHPGGEGFICSFSLECRWFEWVVPRNMETHNLSVRSSVKRLTQLEDVGMQQALSFNREGSILATGGEDGHLRVFKWPSMEVILDQADAYKSVKDLDFSPDGKLLASLGDSGPCKIWDLESFTTVASLPRKEGEIFRFCRFSRSAENQLLYIAVIKQGKGFICSWNTASWQRVRLKEIVQDPISAFNISDDGKLLAVGTAEGGVAIIDSCSFQVHQNAKKAHDFAVSAVDISQDHRAFVSVSTASSARVTIIKDQKPSGFMMWWAIFLVILLAMLVFYLKQIGAF